MGGGGDIVSDAHDTPIRATIREGINYLLNDGYEVDYDRIPAPDNKPIPTGDTYWPVYKEGLECSGIYHRRAAGCQQYAAKFDVMKK